MQQLEATVGEQNVDELDPKNFTSSVKRILPRTDMLATSSLENLKDTSLQGPSNSGYLFENQRSREVDPKVVVVVVKVVLVVFEAARCFQLRIEGNGLRAKLSEVDRRKGRTVRKQQERRRRRELLFFIIL